MMTINLNYRYEVRLVLKLVLPMIRHQQSLYCLENQKFPNVLRLVEQNPYCGFLCVDLVTKSKVYLIVFEVSTFKTSQHRNFYASCYLRNHKILNICAIETKLQILIFFY
jgi:hypothetical protein